jgi:hypothetical protein
VQATRSRVAPNAIQCSYRGAPLSNIARTESPGQRGVMRRDSSSLWKKKPAASARSLQVCPFLKMSGPLRRIGSLQLVRQQAARHCHHRSGFAGTNHRRAGSNRGIQSAFHRYPSLRCRNRTCRARNPCLSPGASVITRERCFCHRSDPTPFPPASETDCAPQRPGTRLLFQRAICLPSPHGCLGSARSISGPHCPERQPGTGLESQ